MPTDCRAAPQPAVRLGVSEPSAFDRSGSDGLQRDPVPLGGPGRDVEAAAANAARTSASRSMKIPDARSVPPGRSSSRSSGARAIRTDAIRFARTTSWAGSPLGRLPVAGGDPARQPVPGRVRERRLDRDRVRVDPEDGRRRPASRRRSRGSPSRSRRRGPARRRAARGPPPISTPARHSRVVGWSPVPNAIPGIQVEDDVVGLAACSRQVGLITIRRPTRRTGKCAFHASAQSASWTIRVVSSPIGRRPNAWR